MLSVKRGTILITGGLAIGLLVGLLYSTRERLAIPVEDTVVVAVDSQAVDHSDAISGRLPSPTEKLLRDMGLVNILDMDTTLVVDLVYATADNFMEEVLYDDLREAYLIPEAAASLVRAHESLKSIDPEYRLVIYDAARPISVQKRMWETAVRQGKQYYVANPANGGGLHNYGAAVDLAILDANGNMLPMGTGYDHLGFEANTDNEQELVKYGNITEQELRNRLLLRKVMFEAGFHTIASEWWHFNFCTKEEATEKYRLIDF